MKRLLLLALVPVALLLGACGGGPTTAADPGPASERSSAASGATPSVTQTPDPEPADADGAGVPELLDFTGTTVDGEQFSGASLAGTPTVLWFWAPWCPTCRSQVPQVEALARDLGDRVDVVGIGSLDSAEAIAAFAGDVEGITQLEDVDGALWKRFGITEQSSFVVLDDDGTVAFQAGYGGSDDLDSQVEALLG